MCQDQYARGKGHIPDPLSKIDSSAHVPLVLSDNQSVVDLAHNPVHYARTKHLELDLFFV